MHVAVDDEGAPRHVLGPQARQGDGDVAEQAVAAREVIARVVGSAAEVHADAVGQRAPALRRRCRPWCAARARRAPATTAARARAARVSRACPCAGAPPARDAARPRSTSRARARHSWISSGRAMPSASSRARRSAYLPSGNRCAAGSGNVNRSWLQRSMCDERPGVRRHSARAIAACVTGQRSGCPQTSGSHMRQITRLATEPVVSAQSMRSSIGSSARRSAGSSTPERRGDRLAARCQGLVGGPAAVGGQVQRDRAAVAVAAPSLDEAARLEAVGQAHDARVGEGQRLAQQLQRLALGVVAQRDQRGRIAAGESGAVADGRVGAVGERQRQGALEVGRRSSRLREQAGRRS